MVRRRQPVRALTNDRLHHCSSLARPRRSHPQNHARILGGPRSRSRPLPACYDRNITPELFFLYWFVDCPFFSTYGLAFLSLSLSPRLCDFRDPLKGPARLPPSSINLLTFPDFRLSSLDATAIDCGTKQKTFSSACYFYLFSDVSVPNKTHSFGHSHSMWRSGCMLPKTKTLRGRAGVRYSSVLPEILNFLCFGFPQFMSLSCGLF